MFDAILCLVSLVLDIRWTIDTATTTAAFACFDTKRIKYRLITININNFWFYFTFLIVIEIHFNELTLGRLQPKNIIAEINNCFTNPNIFISYYSCSLNTYEFLKHH